MFTVSLALFNFPNMLTEQSKLIANVPWIHKELELYELMKADAISTQVYKANNLVICPKNMIVS